MRVRRVSNFIPVRDVDPHVFKVNDLENGLQYLARVRHLTYSEPTQPREQCMEGLTDFIRREHRSGAFVQRFGKGRGWLVGE